MMQVKTCAVALFASALTAGVLQAQATPASAKTVVPVAVSRNLTAADLSALRTELKSSKKQMTAENLRLTPDEATKFWPVYDEYAAELTKLKDARYALVAEYVNTYGKYTDAQAATFIQKWLDADVNEERLRAQYVPKVNKVLPGIKSATFFQIDRRLNMAISLQSASQLPILQLQSEIPK